MRRHTHAHIHNSLGMQAMCDWFSVLESDARERRGTRARNERLGRNDRLKTLFAPKLSVCERRALTLSLTSNTRSEGSTRPTLVLGRSQWATRARWTTARAPSATCCRASPWLERRTACSGTTGAGASGRSTSIRRCTNSAYRCWRRIWASHKFGTHMYEYWSRRCEQGGGRRPYERRLGWVRSGPS